MIFDEALKTLITSDPGFVQLAESRLYPLIIPQDATLPAVAFQEIGADPLHAHDGPNDLMVTRIQFTLDAKSSREVKTLAKVLRGILDGYKGTVGGIQITSILWENEIDGYGASSEVPTIRQDYKIKYKE